MTGRRLFGAIRHAARTSVQFATLLPEPYAGCPIRGSRRDVAELLAHLAQVPREEMLLMQGLSKEAIGKRLKRAVGSIGEVRGLLILGTDELERFADHLGFDRVLPNSDGLPFTVFDWCLEALQHLVHHRGQLLTHLVSSGIPVPGELLKTMFAGHL